MNLYIPIILAGFVAFPAFAAERYAPTLAQAPVCEAGDNTCIVIAQNQTFELSDFGAIDFIGVTEDSRCPVDVYCFWAGRVRVELKHQGLNSSQKFEVGLGGNLPQIWLDEATGVQLSLEQVWPERNLSLPRQEPYQIKLRIIDSAQETPTETPDTSTKGGLEQDSPVQNDQAL
jgi:hypothetical protein